MNERELNQDQKVELENKMIGEKFVLWREGYQRDAYKDQFGRAQDGYVVLKEEVVTIMEVKEVPCMFSNGKATGWRAITENGVEYTCNWYNFPDDSMTPTFYWDVVEQVLGDLWRPVDACKAYNLRVAVYVKQDGTKAIPSGAQICEPHDQAFLEGDDCFDCYVESLGPRLSAHTTGDGPQEA